MRKRNGIGASGLLGDHCGGPLAEFALLIPFLIAILFGAFEFARILYIQQIVTKGVQDAARFVARSPSTTFGTGCPPSGPGWNATLATAETLATRGDTTATALLFSDFTTDTLTIQVNCAASGDLLTPLITGTSIPVVSVSAEVPVTDIGFFSFLAREGITLRASHEEMGVGL